MLEDENKMKPNELELAGKAEVSLADRVSKLIQEMLEWGEALLHAEPFMSLPERAKGRLEQDLAGLRKLYLKSLGGELTLGIAGEPFCGKSSFVNAFLAYNILPGSLPGSKLSLPIAFKHGKIPFLILYMRDGREFEYPCSDLASLGEKLGEITERSELKDIERIICQGNFPALPDGVCLVELPALDGGQALSESARKLGAFCDVLLALGHINHPLSLSLLGEVKKLRGKNAENCIFIATACDLLSEPELKRMRLYFFSRLKERFSGTPPFYFVSALAALDTGSEKLNDIYDHESFALFRKDLLEALEPIRDGLIQGACLREAESLILDMRETLEAIKESLQEQARNEIFDNSERREEIINNIKEKFQEMAGRSFMLLQGEVKELLDNMRGILLHKLAGCEDLTALRTFAVKQNPLLLEIFIRQFVKNFTASFNEQTQRNINRINFKYDLECYFNTNGLQSQKLRDILVKGGEFAECKDSLAAMTGNGIKRGNLHSQKNTLSWFSGLLDGLGAFASSLLERSRGEDLARARNIFQDRIEYCFNCLGKRMPADFKNFYDEILDRQEKELTELLQRKVISNQDEKIRGEDKIQSLQHGLNELERQEALLSEFAEKAALLRKLAKKI